MKIKDICFDRFTTTTNDCSVLDFINDKIYNEYINSNINSIEIEIITKNNDIILSHDFIDVYDNYISIYDIQLFVGGTDRQINFVSLNIDFKDIEEINYYRF